MSAKSRTTLPPDLTADSAEPPKTAGKTVGAVVAAIKVLRSLHEALRPLSASEVARAAGLYRGTAFNILKTLQRQGLIVYDADLAAYYIGTKLLEFAHGVLRTSGLMDVVRPELFSLAESCGVSVFIAKVEGYDLVLLDFVGGGFRADAYFSVGRRSPGFSGAPGVVMAAFSGVSMQYVADHYNATEWFKRPSFADFSKRVREAKRRGFAVDRGNRRNGLAQVAVPVFEDTGRLSLVITAVGFSYAMNDKTVKSVAAHALASADRISGQLGKLRLE